MSIDLADDRPPLRIATAGSVDDGKSTLIGRLLHDTKTIFEDQLNAVTKASRRYGDGSLNLALVTDGLRSEREQGITIDVAYRYVTTPRREFIIADTPGHAQYTRNMVTGASVSDVAIVLVDARHGAVEQTTRHVAIASLLGVGAIILAVNKMDLVGWDEETFLTVAKEVRAIAESVPGEVPVIALPVSALEGDNVVERSDKSPWYGGPSLLETLEEFEVRDREPAGARLAVQWTIVPPNGSTALDRRFAGRLGGGELRVGDQIEVLPSGTKAVVSGIERFGRDIEVAEAGWAIGVRLDRAVDAGRGSVLTSESSAVTPTLTTELTAEISWFIDRALEPGGSWLVKHHSTLVRATVIGVDHRLDTGTLAAIDAEALELNDIGRVRLTLSEPLVADRYVDQHEGGRFVLIDESTNETAGAGIIVATSATSQEVTP